MLAWCVSAPITHLPPRLHALRDCNFLASFHAMQLRSSVSASEPSLHVARCSFCGYSVFCDCLTVCM